MDNTKKYIEMCQQAAKDLPGAYDKPPDPSDVIAMEQTVGERDFEVMTGLQMWHRMAPRDPITSDRLIIKLYKQDELQEMVYEKPSEQSKFPHIAKFSMFWWAFPNCIGVAGVVNGKEKVTLPYLDYFNSMEQLWLAFVMKEKHNKTWNGKEWVNA